MDNTASKEAALAMLQDFMQILRDADMDKRDVTNWSFELALDVAPHIAMEVGATPHDAEIKLRAAMLLREAKAVNERS